MQRRFVIVIFYILTASVIKGQDNVNQQNPNTILIEKEKLQLEKEKIEIERQRLKNETAGKYITGVSILLPLITAVLILLIQKRNTEKLQELQSNADFQIKAVEIILASKSTKAAKERAIILMTLFPQRIPQSFVDAFTKNIKFPGLAYQEKKLELFKALAANLEKRKEVQRIFNMVYLDENLPKEFIENWEKTFPEDRDWAKEIKSKIKDAEG